VGDDVPEDPSEVNCFLNTQLCQKDTTLVLGSTLTRVRIQFANEPGNDKDKGKDSAGRKLLTKGHEKNSGDKHEGNESGGGDKHHDKKNGDGHKEDKKSSGGLFVWHW
jgi:hypothetical protein